MLLRFQTCTADPARLRVWRGSEEQGLTATEARVLHYLAERRGSVVGQEELLREVWGYSPKALSRTVPTTVARLRQKIEADPKRPAHLETVHGEGYRLVLPTVERDVGPVFGRAAELAELEQLLASGRCAALIGPAGVGKTHLARAIAVRHLAIEVDVHERLVESVAGALDLPGDSPEAVAPALRERGELLLVLDGVEAATELGVVREWLERAPALRILLTSQVAIEEVPNLPLAPLDPDAAARLFLHCAFPSRPSLQDGPALRALLDRLDRLPLAIQLGAGWMEVLRPEEALDLSPLVLADGLAAALTRSWSLLGEGERRALVAVSVFEGRFSAAAALALSEAPQHVRSLQRRSWIAREGEDLRLLDGVRAFVSPRVDDRIRHLHLRWCAEQGGTWADRLAAVRWGAARDRALAVRVARALDIELAHANVRTRMGLHEAIDPGTDPDLLCGHAVALKNTDRGAGAVALLREALPQLAGEARGRVLVCLGWSLAESGRLAEAAEPVGEGLAMLEGRHLGLGLVTWGGLLRRQGRFDASLDAVRRGRAILERDGTPDELAGALCIEATGLGRVQGPEVAIPVFRRALEIGDRPRRRAVVAVQLGKAYLAAGQLDDARTWLAEAAEFSATQGRAVPEVDARVSLAAIHHRRGESDDALMELQRAGAVAAAARAVRARMAVALALAQVYLDRDEPHSAREHAGFGATTAEELGEQLTLGWFEEARAHAALLVGDRQEALGLLERARDRFEALGRAGHAARAAGWVAFLRGTAPPALDAIGDPDEVDAVAALFGGPAGPEPGPCTRLALRVRGD